MLGLAYRYLARHWRRKRTRLPDGRSFELLSAITLRGGSAWQLLALEYVSELPTPEPERLRDEAHAVLEAVAASPEFARCLEATVTVRSPRPNRAAAAAWKQVFGFQRRNTAAAWESAPTSE